MPDLSMPFVEEWQFHEGDADMMLSVMARPFPTSLPFADSGQLDFMEASCAWSISDDLSSQHATLAGGLRDQSFLVDQVQNCAGDHETSFHLLPSSAIMGYQVGQSTFTDGSYDCSAKNDQNAIASDSAGPTIADLEEQESHNDQQDVDAASERVIKRRPRTQNHSCDPCRTGKKACDLKMNVVINDKKLPSTSCSTCETRGVECTVKWLASRQSSQKIKNRAQTTSRLREQSDSRADDSVQLDRNTSEDSLLIKNPAPPPTCETDLVRQFTARETCLHQFCLYVDMVEMPITECLSRGCMPPTFPKGLAALSPLSTDLESTLYWDQAQSWIDDCWEVNKSSYWTSNTTAPHLYLAASVLDLLFQAPPTSVLRSPPFSGSRNASINETYKWVAMAAAAQYVLDNDKGASSRARDVASATWYKAKQLVFSNMAAVSSFRMALSLMLFGAILPPLAASGDSTCDEDAAFAHCEGIRRLQHLCFQARGCISGAWSPDPRLFRPGRPCKNNSDHVHPVQSLPSEAQENVLELLGAMQWLVVICNSVVISLSQGRVCAMPPHMAGKKAGRLLLTREIGPSRSDSRNSSAGTYDQAIQDSILTRARADVQPIVALWRRDIATDAMSDAVRKSGSLVVLLYHTLALLTVDAKDVDEESDALYDGINQNMNMFMKLADAWRSGFGRFDRGLSSLNGARSGERARQNVFFCSNDGDLAILLFHKLVDQLEVQLANVFSFGSPAKERLCATIRSTRTYRKKQRLTSAMQISFLASEAQDQAREQQFNDSDDHRSRSMVDDITAHPQPYMIVQTHNLAAEAFADDIQTHIAQMDTVRASEMMAHLNACLTGLQNVKQRLVRFSDIGD